MPQGTTTINFGSYPGAADASVAVTGQTGIQSTSLVEAWIYPSTTADHSADEHLVDPPRVIAGNIVVGTGFTVYGFSRDEKRLVDQSSLQEAAHLADTGTIEVQDVPYGQWTVAWVWS